MRREEIIRHHEEAILKTASGLFGFRQDELKVFASYEGCANLVYGYEQEGQPRILRISYRPDRTAEQIQAELHFLTYLAEHGVRVSAPMASQNGELLETIWVEGIPLHVVSFVKGRGKRVPDNGYRYREDAPIEEYFLN